jgi:hypothetical protein
MKNTASIIPCLKQGVANRNHQPPPPSAGHTHQCSNTNKRLFGPDSWEDELPSTGPTKSS